MKLAKWEVNCGNPRGQPQHTQNNQRFMIGWEPPFSHWWPNIGSSAIVIVQPDLMQMLKGTRTHKNLRTIHHWLYNNITVYHCNVGKTIINNLPNHHFYGFFLNHSQSVVYDTVLTTLVFHSPSNHLRIGKMPWVGPLVSVGVLGGHGHQAWYDDDSIWFYKRQKR